MINDDKELKKERSLHEYCRNATNKEGDTFVGIKSEIKNEINEISISFPIGFNLPDNEEDAREDILLLIESLQKYKEESFNIAQHELEQKLKVQEFPINAYLTVISDYYRRKGYYKETEDVYVRRRSGKINYNKTIKKKKAIALVQGFAYLNNQVRKRNDSDKDLITKINQYCVYESFIKIGWLYTKFLPPKPLVENYNNIFQAELIKKLNSTYKDNDRILFQSMLDILNYKDIVDNKEKFYFGTNNFECIWENLIENVFGIKNKEKYFPRTYWKLNRNEKYKNMALEPDTIMLCNGNIFVLDAKYYKFGVTGNPLHLPNSSSINKQITYGEYIAKSDKFIFDRKKGMNTYNAFLMPYNKNYNMFTNKKKDYLGIGEAIGEWKNSNYDYEHVIGILVDVKTIMSIRTKYNKSEMRKLSEEIINQLNKK